MTTLNKSCLVLIAAIATISTHSHATPSPGAPTGDVIIDTATPQQTALAAAPSVAPPSALFLIIKDGKWGLIDVTGKIVAEPKYDQLGGFPLPERDPVVRFFQLLPRADRDREIFLKEEPRVPAGFVPWYCLKGRCGALARNGSELIPPRYEAVGDRFYAGRIAVQRQGLWGFVNEAGVEVIPTRYEALGGDFHTGRLAVRRQGRWGFINEAGSEVIPPTFLKACMFHGNTAMVQIAEKQWTMIDVDGHSVVDPPWKEMPTPIPPPPYCGLPDQPLTPAREDGRWGVLDRSGHWAIPPTFEEVGQFRNGLAPASRDQKWGFIDATGKWVVEPRFDQLEGLGCPSDDSSIIRIGNQKGVIDRAGSVRFLLPAIAIICTQGPLLRYIKEGRSEGGCSLIGLVDPAGHVVVEPKYGFIDDRYAGMYRARTCSSVAGKPDTVYFDSAGKIFNNVTNDLAFEVFHEGLAIYQSSSGKSGFMDQTGRVVIEAVYDRALNFQDGLALVKLDDQVKYIDHAGRVVYSMRF